MYRAHWSSYMNLFIFSCWFIKPDQRAESAEPHNVFLVLVHREHVSNPEVILFELIKPAVEPVKSAVYHAGPKISIAIFIYPPDLRLLASSCIGTAIMLKGAVRWLE